MIKTAGGRRERKDILGGDIIFMDEENRPRKVVIGQQVEETKLFWPDRCAET